MRKSAFTLIEVLVAVGIIAVVGLALLQIGSNNTKMIGYLLDREGIYSRASVIALNAEDGMVNETETLYDLVGSKISIQDDDILKVFKEYKFNVTVEEQEPINLLDLFTEDEEDSIQDEQFVEYDEEAEDASEDMLDFELMFEKISITTTKHSAIFYRLKSENEDANSTDDSSSTQEDSNASS